MVEPRVRILKVKNLDFQSRGERECRLGKELSLSVRVMKSVRSESVANGVNWFALDSGCFDTDMVLSSRPS